ncbi:MAG: type IV pilus modification protein PilV [Gammaproteobacteria bacterium]|nr:type IV pilus modification protein PilV [Gammaproteobacteria bacterium]
MISKNDIATYGRSFQTGFSLIEVLVALLVLSIGLLGLAALQTTSLKFNTDSYLRTQATYFVYDIVDRMRANSDSIVDGGTYDVPDAASAASIISTYQSCKGSTCACNAASICNTTQIATHDLGRWYERMQTVLPGALDSLATIDVDAARRVTVTIRWTERDISKSQKWEVLL